MVFTSYSFITKSHEGNASWSSILYRTDSVQWSPVLFGACGFQRHEGSERLKWRRYHGCAVSKRRKDQAPWWGWARLFGMSTPRLQSIRRRNVCSRTFKCCFSTLSKSRERKSHRLWRRSRVAKFVLAKRNGFFNRKLMRLEMFLLCRWHANPLFGWLQGPLLRMGVEVLSQCSLWRSGMRW